MQDPTKMGHRNGQLGKDIDSVIDRLCYVERQLGIITPPTGSPATSAAGAPAALVVDEDGGVHPRLAAYDEHVARTLVPFADACAALGPEMEKIGSSVKDVWAGMRLVVELGTAYKKPSGPAPAAVQSHLKPCQDAMSSIQKARLDRKFDWHIKAIMEMLACVSWVVVTPPPSPAIFVKDTVEASDFWANKIRKEYKGKGNEGEGHVRFCDAMKALVLDLSAYLKEHHLSGLAWNPRGKDFAEAKVGEGGGVASGNAKKAGPVVTSASAPSTGGSAGGVFAELMKKKTEDGSSAATGLKKVTREQQTWRKEYKKDDGAAPVKPDAPTKPVTATKFGAKKTLGTPKCEYQERGCKWIIENQTKETCEGGVCKVTVTDAKQQVYIYNCENATVQITGKLKSIILDSCVKLGVIFDTAISACEIVNCKSVQVQATNVCPSFAIDKTDGIVVHLTGNEAISQTVFVTSKSSEMNVSWVDDDGEVKESPIPEQFMHRLVNGSVTSQVSDLYH
ncbi:hypothetical protein ACHAW5_011294 [Stephanodiscus triporus]|uniref:C-CAP/cofactor C-like domain-containing protein n=1 Tax=Stephanodiscus triporus TaxID=2934178 RepID=A0ABD3MLV5_9STRA